MKMTQRFTALVATLLILPAAAPEKKPDLARAKKWNVNGVWLKVKPPAEFTLDEKNPENGHFAKSLNAPEGQKGTLKVSIESSTETPEKFWEAKHKQLTESVEGLDAEAAQSRKISNVGALWITTKHKEGEQTIETIRGIVPGREQILTVSISAPVEEFEKNRVTYEASIASAWWLGAKIEEERKKPKEGSEDDKEYVIEVTNDTFKKEVLESKVPVVVDFWAPWCGPCKLVAPVIEDLAKGYDGKVKFVKLNTDDNEETARKYKIEALPSILLFREGKEIDRKLGAQEKLDYMKWIRPHLD